jgi:hypothetical protein
MKNLTFYSSSLLFVIGISLIPYNCKAQDIKLTRQEKKDLRQTELNTNYQAIDTLIERKTFVIEADYLQDQNGSPVPVNSVLNYILVDSVRVVLQTGSNFRSGYNGVGGVTAQGNIQNYKDVSMNISANTNATAIITGLSRGSLTWKGYIQNLYKSDVYKGQETF